MSLAAIEELGLGSSLVGIPKSTKPLQGSNAVQIVDLIAL